MTAELRGALLTAPLAAVATVAVVLLGLFLGLAILIGEPSLAVAGVAWIVLLLTIVAVPTAYVLTGFLVGVARVTNTSLSAVSYRSVAIAAVTGILVASYGLLWLADNLGEWWMPFFAAPAGVVGARVFVTRRAGAVDVPAAS